MPPPFLVYRQVTRKWSSMWGVDRRSFNTCSASATCGENMGYWTHDIVPSVRAIWGIEKMCRQYGPYWVLITCAVSMGHSYRIDRVLSTCVPKATWIADHLTHMLPGLLRAKTQSLYCCCDCDSPRQFRRWRAPCRRHMSWCRSHPRPRTGRRYSLQTQRGRNIREKHWLCTTRKLTYACKYSMATNSQILLNSGASVSYNRLSVSYNSMHNASHTHLTLMHKSSVYGSSVKECLVSPFHAFLSTNSWALIC